MNQLQVFNNEEFGQVRTVIQGEDVWFVAKDVAEVLGYNNTSKAIQMHVDEDEKADLPIWDGRQNRNQKVINESGLYSLILSSKLPSAKKFKKWVTSEVLPSIRKHGAYMTDQVLEQAVTNPDFAIGLLTKLKEEKEKLAAAQQQIVQQQRLVTFAKACMQSNESLKVSEVAKLAAKHNIKIGQRQLFTKLREWNLIFKRSTEPTQSAVEKGYFEIAQGVKQKPSGEPFTWTTTYVTPKGQAYIIDRLKKEQEQEAI
ncbi:MULTISPECIES: phage antirepressor Ant [Bacillus]|uniref:phage antirepressor Ant n=1 Tax=Bacillus cereus group TaxID=86661 RepID=UPI0001A02F69|nr:MULTISPECIES: phage antirepressor Ant [Bacillus cereus group]EEK64309.1 Antirepressor, phage associated [Bacillus wiedmannii]MDA2666553.1 phage antirepressor Ant [Bacillus cereus group sp. Bc032]MDA2677263.1 phage antirepressor Ant [Bacillus cereus group sp. Bc031]MDA2682761.1 phage antirepressor Ant [Bacillus cereus group sp. Bc029]MDA2688208.1 phage antirepressor Ant [Bacillus cereus group sp. Bc030]